MRILLVGALVLGCVPGVLATVLFFAQGGFGGGHGPLDYAIYILTVPGGWILSSAYEYLPGGLPDFVAIIWIPVMINVLLAESAVIAVGFPAMKFLGSGRKSAEP